jgi:hypothetical protein
MNAINPQQVESIEVISPLSALKEKGFDYVGRIIKVSMKKK